MTKKVEEDSVPEALCVARRETIIEKIDGLKKTIYVSGAAITAVIVIVQFILTLWKG